MSKWDNQREAEVRGRCDAASPGPWAWNINLKSKHMVLESARNGLEIVLDFVRWGMDGAMARFRDGHDVMTKADKYALKVPGREHHSGWFQTLSHPDADFIAHSRTDLEDALAEIRRLRGDPHEYPTDGSSHELLVQAAYLPARGPGACLLNSASKQCPCIYCRAIRLSRQQALEEAAKVADRMGLTCCARDIRDRGKEPFDLENHNRPSLGAD